MIKASIFKRKRFWLCLIALLLLSALLSVKGVRVLLTTTANIPIGAKATPSLDTIDLPDWEAQRAELLSQFESQIYGNFPDSLTFEHKGTHKIDGTHFNKSARLEVQNFSILNDAVETGRRFNMIVVRPAHQNKPVPIIIMQTFCPNHNTIPHPDIPLPDEIFFSCDGDSLLSPLFGYFFGQYITTPPIEEIMQRGYAIAAIYPSEFIPDQAELGMDIINKIFNDQHSPARTGAIMAWAAQLAFLADWFEQDPTISNQITFGHSRFGKTALVAALYSPAVDAVIAHQSGTGGASLNRDKAGETVIDITESYPFWFAPDYARFGWADDKEILIDQHQLIALIAPRPILLGNAKRDVWSDPNGAFRALMGASPIYKLYGSSGLETQRLNEFMPNSVLSFWLRPGTHGIVTEDWPAFLEFLDAHFK